MGNGITPDVAKRRIGGSAVPICAQLPEVADNLRSNQWGRAEGYAVGHCDRFVIKAFYMKYDYIALN